MSVGLAILVGLGGGIGSTLRFGADSWLRPLFSGSISWSTVLINTSGSLLLGILTGVFAGIPEAATLTVLGSGVLGGYTTFSTASVEAATLLRAGKLRAAATYAGGTLVISAVAAVLGLTLGHLLTASTQ